MDLVPWRSLLSFMNAVSGKSRHRPSLEQRKDTLFKDPLLRKVPVLGTASVEGGLSRAASDEWTLVHPCAVQDSDSEAFVPFQILSDFWICVYLPQCSAIFFSHQQSDKSLVIHTGVLCMCVFVCLYVC